MPKYAGNWFRLNYAVENAFDKTLSSLKNTHGDLGKNVKTNLMKVCYTKQNIEVYNKDDMIESVIKKLSNRLGQNSFVIIDYWQHDKTAIGICSPQNYYMLVYISTFNTQANHYNVRLESPPTEYGEIPYTESGKYYAVNFEELVEITNKHFSRIIDDKTTH